MFLRAENCSNVNLRAQIGQGCRLSISSPLRGVLDFVREISAMHRLFKASRHLPLLNYDTSVYRPEGGRGEPKPQISPLICVSLYKSTLLTLKSQL